ncbi:FAD-dependent monooxygenase [uncultured Tenacibaculum sp.]|uniref:FAD-dependent monooxygenase n=1 Tax=uncultured Tenacibaculum sp. TaxID=174713 RepID=UPI002624717E|nr:FAD-dependent monooxygenase [uncultured Tenacibaculum sp.]
MRDKDSKIAILGAGIGGLTTAIALYQKGFKNLSIYERRNTVTTMGAGLVLWSNATKIFHKLGLLTEIEKLGGQLLQMQRWTKNKDYLGAIEVNKINKHIGFKSYSIGRTDLQNILLNKINELNIPIHYNHNALNISYQNNITSVNFENGISIHTQIVIGADGRINSMARQYVNGNNTPVYQNFVNWIGIVESKKLIFSKNNVMDFWGTGERFGIVTINKNKGYWAGGKSLPINASFKNKNHKTELLKLFDSWPPEIKEIIKLTKEENIKYIEVFDHNPTLKWYKNNVCLIGDSAHASLPTSGQGACQAIEDAWHFAAILEQSETIEEAFSKFQENRFQKTTAITMAGRNLAKSLFNENVLYSKERNEKAKNTDYNLASQSIAELWSKNLPK